MPFVRAVFPFETRKKDDRISKNSRSNFVSYYKSSRTMKIILMKLISHLKLLIISANKFTVLKDINLTVEEIKFGVSYTLLKLH